MCFFFNAPIFYEYRLSTFLAAKKYSFFLRDLVNLLGIELEYGVTLELHGGGELPGGQAEVPRRDHELVHLHHTSSALDPDPDSIRSLDPYPD
jgi:hypothetical protein